MSLNTRMTRSSGPDDPAVGVVAINYANGDQVLAVTSRGIYISSAGDLEVVMQDGSTAVFEGLLAGILYPLAVRTIVADNSTAAGLVLL